MISKETFRQLALSFPDSTELPHFERASFRANKKIFATLDEANDRACIMLSEIDQSVFSEIDKTVIYPVPNKWGKQGATYFELKTVRKTVLKHALQLAHERVHQKKKSVK
jgi:hypothetical protein